MQRNTPSKLQSKQFVTVTYPSHPLSGHTLRVIKVFRRKLNMYLIYQVEEGTSATIPLEWTDYEDNSEKNPVSSDTLLDVSRLRQLVKIVDGIKEQESVISEEQNSG